MTPRINRKVSTPADAPVEQVLKENDDLSRGNQRPQDPEYVVKRAEPRPERQRQQKVHRLVGKGNPQSAHLSSLAKSSRANSRLFEETAEKASAAGAGLVVVIREALDVSLHGQLPRLNAQLVDVKTGAGYSKLAHIGKDDDGLFVKAVHVGHAGYA